MNHVATYKYPMFEKSKPRITIQYCPKCNWLPRSSWMAQEILGTFVEEICEVALIPAENPGLFEIRIDGEILWCRKQDGGFPDVKTLKQRVRDRIAPGRDLGHVDQ